MIEIHLGDVEARFADIIWQEEPISTAVLAKIAGSQFGWKKTTAYTVLKRLCDKGIFQNENGVVHSLISRGDFLPHKANILSIVLFRARFRHSLLHLLHGNGSRILKLMRFSV